MRPDPPPGLRWTGRHPEVELIDPQCPRHGDEHFVRGWVPCRTGVHGPAGHNQWRLACGLRLYGVDGAHVERPDCL